MTFDGSFPLQRQRDRVLAEPGNDLYPKACDRSWREVASVMLGTGMRFGEDFAHFRLNSKGIFGEPGRTRTYNPLIKSQLLYH